MTLSIRPPQSVDRPAWEGLWAQYNAYYGRQGDTALCPDVVDSTWARLLDDAAPVCGLLAEQAQGIVGLVHVVFHRNLIQKADTCYMQDLFTAPAVRGGGVAQALIDGAGRLCQSRGVSDMYWHTHKDNRAARNLYDRVARDTEFVVYRINPLLQKTDI